MVPDAPPRRSLGDRERCRSTDSGAARGAPSGGTHGPGVGVPPPWKPRVFVAPELEPTKPLFVVMRVVDLTAPAVLPRLLDEHGMGGAETFLLRDFVPSPVDRLTRHRPGRPGGHGRVPAISETASPHWLHRKGVVWGGPQWFRDNGSKGLLALGASGVASRCTTRSSRPMRDAAARRRDPGTEDAPAGNGGDVPSRPLHGGVLTSNATATAVTPPQRPRPPNAVCESRRRQRLRRAGQGSGPWIVAHICLPPRTTDWCRPITRSTSSNTARRGQVLLTARRGLGDTLAPGRSLSRR